MWLSIMWQAIMWQAIMWQAIMWQATFLKVDSWLVCQTDSDADRLLPGEAQRHYALFACCLFAVNSISRNFGRTHTATIFNALCSKKTSHGSAYNRQPKKTGSLPRDATTDLTSGG